MKDFVLDSEQDIAIADNDLLIDDSDQQQQQRLLLTEKGNIKQFPNAGVGTQTFLEAEDEAGFLREVSTQFAADGMKVKELRIERINQTVNLKLNAPYENS